MCERLTIFNNIITFSQSEIIIDSDQVFFDTNIFYGLVECGQDNNRNIYISNIHIYLQILYTFSFISFTLFYGFLIRVQRASQIRSSPFTGDSSDDSSDGEGEHTNTANTHSVATRITNSSSTDNTDTSLSSSSPSKSHKTASTFSPVKHNSSGSPSKSTNLVLSLMPRYKILGKGTYG